MRLISVNGETAVHHVDERPWKCTIRLLSGSNVKLPQQLFYIRGRACDFAVRPFWVSDYTRANSSGSPSLSVVLMY